MSRIAIGLTVWAPRNLKRDWCIRTTLNKLSQALLHDRSARFDLLVVDNDSGHPAIVEELRTLSTRFPGARVFRFSPQLGWAGARNFLIQRFVESPWERLILMDHDIAVLDPLWITRVEALIDQEPALHAFMLLGYRYEHAGETVLPTSGAKAIACAEFTGAVHVISREVARAVGGYNTSDFPLSWGFHDVEYGLRIRAAGLLDGVDRRFLDPIRAPVIHLDPNEIEVHNARAPILEKYSAVFRDRAAQIERGERIFHSYSRSVIPSDVLREVRE